MKCLLRNLMPHLKFYSKDIKSHKIKAEKNNSFN